MALNQDIQLRILAAVEGVEKITSLGGALDTVKAAASGLVGALFVNELGEMVMEADKANKNIAMFSRTMKVAGIDADDARKKVDDFAVSVGVSRNEMEEHVAQLVNNGLGLQESIALTSAALDTGTAAGKKATESMEALTSAMITGDSQYLNTLGITQNFTQTYNEFAVSIGKTVSALTEQEKMTARVQHVMKYASQDMGAHAAQMDGITGLISRYESQLRAVRRELGQEFIPVWEAVYQIMLKNITGFEGWLKSSDAVKNVAQFIKTGVEQAAKVLDYLRSRAVELKPALENFAKAGSNVIHFVENFVSKGTNGAKSADSFREALDFVVDTVNNLSKGVLWVSRNLDVLLPALAAGAAAWAVMGIAVNGVAFATSALIVGIGAVSSVLAVLTSPITLIVAAVVALGLAWKTNFLGIREWTGAVWEMFKDMWAGMKGIFENLISWLKDKLPQAWEFFKKLFLFSIETSPVGLALKLIPGLFDGITERMLSLWNKAKAFWGWIKGEASNAADTAANGEAGANNTRRADDHSSAPVVGNDIATSVGNDILKTIDQKGKLLSYEAQNYVDRCAKWTREAWDLAEPNFAGKINQLFQTGGERFKDAATGRSYVTPTARSAYRNFANAGLTHNYSDITDLKPGDIIFYADKGQNHVGIYKGDGIVTGNNRVSYARSGRTNPVGDVNIRALGNPTGYVRPAEAQAAWGGSRGNVTGSADGKPGAGGAPADPAKAASQEKARQAAILKVAQEYADKLDAIDAKLAKAKDEKTRTSLFNQRAAIAEEVKHWVNGEKDKQDAFTITLRQRQKARDDAKDQADKLREAQAKAQQESAALANKRWEYQKSVADKVLDSYEEEVKAAEDNKSKLLTIEKVWGTKVLEARTSQAKAQAEIDKQKLRDDFRTATKDDKGNLKVDPSYAAKLQAQLDKDLALVDSKLQTKLKGLQGDAKRAREDAVDAAAQEARDNVATVFGAISTARQATLQNGVSAAQQAYDHEMKLAEGNASKMLAVEERQGRALLAARNKLVNQQTLDSVQATNQTYQRNKVTLEKSGGDVAELTRAWKEQVAAINAAGAAEKSRNSAEQLQVEKDARKDLTKYRAGLNVQDADNALSSLENQLAAGQVAWEKAENQRLRLTEARIQAQRTLDIAGANGNADEIKRINTKADNDLRAARTTTTREIQDHQIAAAATVAEASQAQLENQLNKGQISRTSYEQKLLTITLKSLDAQRDAELRNTNLSEAQREAIRDKYRQLSLKAQIDASVRRREASARASQEDEANQLASLKNIRDARAMSEEDYDQQVRDVQEKRLARERDTALTNNKDGADGAARIWAAYYNGMDALDVQAENKKRDRRIATENIAADTAKTALDGQLESNLLNKQQYDAAALQLDIDRINRGYSLEVEGGKRSADELAALRTQADAQIDAARAGFAAKERQRQQNLYTAQDAAAQASLNNQVAAGKMSTAERDKALLAMQEDTLDRQYMNEVAWGQHTTEELVVIWNKYLADKEALHLAELEKERQHALDVEGKRASSAAKVAENSLGRGYMTVEQYEQNSDNAALADADRKRRSVTEAPGVRPEDADAAWSDYWAEVDRISIASQKRISDRGLEIQKSGLQNYLDALADSLKRGKMTWDQYEAERLQTQHDLYEAQRKAELSNVTLTAEQRKAINDHYDLLEQAAQTDHDEAKRQMIVKGQSELRQSELADQARGYSEGLVSLDAYLSRRAELEEAAAMAQYNEEVKAAQGNADLELAAFNKLQETRKANAAADLKFRNDEQLSKSKETNALELALLEEHHAAKLVGDEKYLREKARLAIVELQMEQKAAEAQEPDPQKRKAVTARYAQAISAVNTQLTQDVKATTRALQDQTSSLLDAGDGWLALTEKLGVLRRDIGDINEKLAAAGVTAQERAQLIAQRNMLIIEMVSQVAQTVVGSLSDFLQAVTGMGSEAADQWAEDMQRMVSDVTSLAKTLASGNWVGAAVQGLQIVWNWFTRNAKAAAEAKKATEDYNKQFRFSQDGYKTRTVQKSSTGFFLWKTDHYKETIDEASKNLALGFEDAVVQGIGSGLADAVKTGDNTALTKSIYSGLKSAALKGLTDAFLNSGEVAAIVGPLIGKLIKAFKSGDKEQIRSALEEFKTGVQALKPQMDALREAGAIVNSELGDAADSGSELADKLGDAGKALQQLYRKGDISAQEYEARLLGLTLQRLAAERAAALKAAGSNAEAIARVNREYDQKEVDAKKEAAREAAGEAKKLLDMQLDTEATKLDNAYAAGLISRKDYEAEKLKLALRRLDAEMTAELAAEGLTQEQIAKIKEKYAAEKQKVRLEFNVDDVTPTVIQLADKLSDAIKSGIENGAKSGIQNAIKTGNTADLAKTIREQVSDNLMGAIIDTFLKSAQMKAIIEPAMNELTAALTDDDPSNDEAALGRFNSALDKYAAMSEKFASRMSDSFRRSGLTQGPVSSSNNHIEEDKALQGYLNDGDPSNDQAAMDAYRAKVGGGGGSSYTIGSAGTISSGNNFDAVVTALNGMRDTAQLQLDAAKLQMQAAQINLQAQSSKLIATYETARMTFNNGGM